MSPSELLEKLDALGTIDARILRKIHRQVESPGKVVKVSAVLKFLVKNGQLTEAEARQLLRESKTTAEEASKVAAPPVTADPAVVEAPKTADHFEVAEAPVDNDHDTGDLIGGVNEEDAPAAPEPIAEPEPIAVPESIAEPEPIAEPEVIEDVVEEVIEEAETVDAPPKKNRKQEKARKEKKAAPVEPEVVIDQTGPAAGFDDQTALDMDAGFDDSPADDRDDSSTVGFQGKIDKSNQWATKWVFIGFGLLATILIAVAVLWIAVTGVSAEDLYRAAEENRERNAFQAAVKQYDEYIEKFPSHGNHHDARAWRAQSVLRTSYESSRYEEVLKRAEIELPPLASDEYKDSKLAIIRDDLSVMLPASLRQITFRATELEKVEEMKAERAKIELYGKTVGNPVYLPPSFRKRPGTAKVLDEIENNIKTLDGHIEKEEDYAGALVDIKQLAAEGKTDDAFQRYRKLTRNYGDLSSREALQSLMLEVSKRESDLVQTVSFDAATSQSPASTVISRSVVLGAKSGTPLAGLRGEVLSFLAEGSVYGVEASDGTIAWRRFVGYQTTVQPQPLDDGSLIVIDGQRDEVLRLDHRTGELIWRTEVGKSMFSPSIAGQRITITTDDGHVMNLNAQSGEVQASVKLPQSANTSAVGSERDPFIYQTGNYSNLYVLGGDDLSAQEVYYVGHDKNSVVIPPYLWSGYVLVAVNSGEDCDLHVLKPTADGLGLSLVQLVSRLTTGPVTTPFQRYGRWLYVIADNGDMRLLELDATNETNPVRSLASDRVDNSSGQKLFALTEGNNLWVSSQGILRYRIKRALGQFNREIVTEPTDTFIAPMQTIDDNLLHVRRRDRSGMISVSLVDKESLDPLWRTDFGGALAGSPVASPKGIMVANNQGDAFVLNGDNLSSGVAGDAVRSSEIVEDLRFKYLIPIGQRGVALTGPIGRPDALYLDTSSGKNRLFAMESPADQPASRPLELGGNLIVPSEKGQVTRINPKNGRMVGTPFQPPIQPGAKTKWFDPIAVGEDRVALTSASAEGAVDSAIYLLDASNDARLSKVASWQPKGQFVSGPIAFGRSLYAVVREGGQDSIISLSVGDSIAVQETASLDGRCVAGPWLVGDRLVMVLDTDQLVSITAPMKPEWSVGLPNQKFAFPPTMTGQQMMVGFQSGLLVWLNPATGKVVNQKELGQPISGAPLVENGKLYFGGRDGTVHEVDPSAW